MESGTRQLPIRGFMDDHTITSLAHVQTRWILKALYDMATWAQMKFKPRKSRSMVIRSGKVTSKFQLQVQGEMIPTIEENPIKCLGKWYDATLTDSWKVSRTEKQADEWLSKIEESGLPGKFKGLALPARSATKTHVATDNVWNSYDSSGELRSEWPNIFASGSESQQDSRQ